MLLSITWSKPFSVLDTKTLKAESCTLPLFMFKVPRLVEMYKETIICNYMMHTMVTEFAL